MTLIANKGELAIKNKIAPEENEIVKDFIFRAIKSVKNSPELDHLLEQKENNINDNFWKWFGSSKVKEGNEPLIVYHGTRSNFNTFKPSKSIGNQGETDQIEGAYFTDNKDAASFFSIADDERYIKSIFYRREQ